MDGTTAIKIDYYEELKVKADKYDEIKGLFENTLIEIEKELDQIGLITKHAVDRYKSLISYKSVITQAMKLIEINS